MHSAFLYKNVNYIMIDKLIAFAQMSGERYQR